MPAERQCTDEVRWLLRGLTLRSGAQQGEQHDAGHQNVCDQVSAAMDVAIRSHYVQRQGDHQHTGRSHVQGLKVPVA